MKKNHWLNVAEYASAVGLGVGSVASIVSSQLLYASAPLSLMVLLGLVNRRRFEQQSQKMTTGAIADLDQRLSKRLDLLSQHVLELPTVETLGGLKKSLLQKDREAFESLSKEIRTLQRELKHRFRPFEEQGLETVREDMEQLHRDYHQLAASLREVTSQLNRLSGANRMDGFEEALTKLKTDVKQLQGNLQDFSNQTKPNFVTLQEQVNHLTRQFQKLPPPIDPTSLKQEVAELVKMVSDLVPKRDLLGLTNEIKELQRQQKALQQTIKKLESADSGSSLQNGIPPMFAHVIDPVKASKLQAEQPTIFAKAPEEEVGELLEQRLNRLLKASALPELYPNVQSTMAAYLGDLQWQVVTLQRATQQLVQQQKTLHDQIHQLPKTLDTVALQHQVKEVTGRIATLEQQTLTFQAQIESNVSQKWQQVNQQMQSLSGTPGYELIFDFKSGSSQPGQAMAALAGSGSRAILDEVLEQTQERLILILPWVAGQNELDQALLQKLAKFLQRQKRLELGWCYQVEPDAHRLLPKLVRGWSINPLRRAALQNTLRQLLKLKQAYPDRFQFKVLGTAENFLVADQNLAIVGIPDTLATHTVFTELQMKLRTTDPYVVQRLIERFEQPTLSADDVTAHWNRAVTRYELGDYGGAIADYTQVLTLNPDDPIAYNYRGMAQYESGNLQSALADFSHSLRLRPDQATAYCNRGFVYSELNDPLSAIADYSLAIQNQPDHAIAYFYRGMVSHQFGDLQGAIKDYSESLHLEPDSAVAHYYRGITYQNLNAHTEAIADLEVAARLFKNLGSKPNVTKARRALAKSQAILSNQLTQPELEFADGVPSASGAIAPADEFGTGFGTLAEFIQGIDTEDGSTKALELEDAPGTASLADILMSTEAAPAEPDLAISPSSAMQQTPTLADFFAELVPAEPESTTETANPTVNSQPRQPVHPPGNEHQNASNGGNYGGNYNADNHSHANPNSLSPSLNAEVSTTLENWLHMLKAATSEPGFHEGSHNREPSLEPSSSELDITLSNSLSRPDAETLDDFCERFEAP